MTRPSVTPLDVDTDEVAPFIVAAIRAGDAIMTTIEALDRRLDRRDRSAISSPYLHAAQRRHFFLFDVVPAALTLAAVALLFVHPLSKTDIVLFWVMWLGTGLGLTVGFHRLFSHRAFAAGPAVSVALLILGSMAARGAMISWVAMHRRHHECSDREGDLHSPNMHGASTMQRLRGWLHAHWTWMMQHDYPNVARYTSDLLRDPVLVRANRHYFVWVTLGLLFPAIFGGVFTESLIGILTGFLWGGAVRMFVVEQSMSAINSFTHLLGSRPFHMPDDNSRNSSLLGLLVWGEGWHNNHHAFPSSAAFGLKRREIDFGYWLIRLLQKLGLAWDVKYPSTAHVARRRERLQSPD
jgi:stearoyl-CoA desaturase (Delta-9 desaturase)